MGAAWIVKRKRVGVVVELELELELELEEVAMVVWCHLG